MEWFLSFLGALGVSLVGMVAFVIQRSDLSAGALVFLFACWLFALVPLFWYFYSNRSAIQRLLTSKDEAVRRKAFEELTRIR